MNKACCIFGTTVLFFVIVSCNRKVNYPEAPKGSGEEALLQRAKLDLMYLNNNTPLKSKQDIYVRPVVPHDSKVTNFFKDIDDVDRNYSVSVVDRTSTSAVVEVRALNEQYSWMGLYVMRVNWIVINNEWKLNNELKTH